VGALFFFASTIHAQDAFYHSASSADVMEVSQEEEGTEPERAGESDDLLRRALEEPPVDVPLKPIHPRQRVDIVAR